MFNYNSGACRSTRDDAHSRGHAPTVEGGGPEQGALL